MMYNKLVHKLKLWHNNQIVTLNTILSKNSKDKFVKIFFDSWNSRSFADFHKVRILELYAKVYMRDIARLVYIDLNLIRWLMYNNI